MFASCLVVICTSITVAINGEVHSFTICVGFKIRPQIYIRCSYSAFGTKLRCVFILLHEILRALSRLGFWLLQISSAFKKAFPNFEARHSF